MASLTHIIWEIDTFSLTAMKITSFEVVKLNLPTRMTLKSVAAWAPGGILNLDEVFCVMASLTTDDGIVGTGTTATVTGYAGMTHDTLNDAVRYLGPSLVGIDPFDIEEAHLRMKGTLGGNYPAKSVFDIALYDIMGKSIQKPIYKLLGGRVRESFVTDRALMTHGKTGKEIAADTAMYMEEGYRGFEVHVGSGLENDVESIKAIRDAGGADIAIIADAHQHWSIKEAIRTIKALERYDVVIESPTKGIRNMGEVKRAVDVPIAADEDCHTIDDAFRIISEGAADVLTIKLVKAGGLYPCKKISDMAQAAGVAIRIDGVPGDTKLSNTAAAHLGMTISNIIPGSGVMQNKYFLREDVVVEGGLTMGPDGKVTVPETPGIGVTTSSSFNKGS